MLTLMGCLHSLLGGHGDLAKENSSAPVVEDPPAEPKPQFSWSNRKKRDPSEYMIDGAKGQTLGKMPGASDGIAFVIQNCEDCNIYLFDHYSQVTIDDCTNCRIFIGPIKTSVFIRDCKDCALMTACQQYRTRDCQRITTFVACTSLPIIEASTGMKFGCFQYYYPELEDQFKKSGLSIYNNIWSNIHDFTPVPGENNFTLLPWGQEIEKFIPLPTEEPFSTVQISLDPETSVVPRTLGKQRKNSEESCLVVFFADGQSHDRAKSFIKDMNNKHSGCVLVQSKEIALQVSDAARIFGSDNYAMAVQQGQVIGLEFNGDGCVKACQDTISEVCQGSTGVVFVSSSQEAANSQIDNFYNYADMQMNA